MSHPDPPDDSNQSPDREGPTDADASSDPGIDGSSSDNSVESSNDLDTEPDDQSPLDDAALRSVAEGVRRSFESPLNRAQIDHALRAALPSFSGISSPAFNQTLQKVLEESVRQSIESPLNQSQIDAALRAALPSFSGISSPAFNQTLQKVLEESVRQSIRSPLNQSQIDAALRAALPSISRLSLQQDQADPPETSGGSEQSEESAARVPILSDEHSGAFENPGSFFAHNEVVVHSLDQFTTAISSLATTQPGTSFVWRGQQDARWALHNSLYRRLLTKRKLDKFPVPPGVAYPSETDMLAAEFSILQYADEWRMSDLPALELFARLQHQGGPTRLLDVTRNPMIAAWFAVESGGDLDKVDARIFAIATSPNPSRLSATVNDFDARARMPFWSYMSEEDREASDWGTGAIRETWTPPAFDPRISSQNAAFLLDGVPFADLTDTDGPRDHQEWTHADILASTSIHCYPADPGVQQVFRAGEVAPIFTFRIKAAAKAEMRETLTQFHGFTHAHLYPDIQGMRARLLSDDWITNPSVVGS